MELVELTLWWKLWSWPCGACKACKTCKDCKTCKASKACKTCKAALRNSAAVPCAALPTNCLWRPCLHLLFISLRLLTKIIISAELFGQNLHFFLLLIFSSVKNVSDRWKAGTTLSFLSTFLSLSQKISFFPGSQVTINLFQLTSLVSLPFTIHRIGHRQSLEKRCLIVDARTDSLDDFPAFSCHPQYGSHTHTHTHTKREDESGLDQVMAMKCGQKGNIMHLHV